MVLERTPEVIKQKMIHHRHGGLQEYALQSRSGDIFLELFLTATTNEKDRVHITTIRTAYERYCNVTNSTSLSNKALRTLIQDRMERHWEKDIRIGDLNKSGYKALKFDAELFEETITILKKARTEGKPIFPALLIKFPDLQNSTNSTLFYQNSTTKTTISNLFCRIVENVEKNRDSLGERKEYKKIPPENLTSKNSTNSTILHSEPNDNDLDCRVFVENVELVEEFLADGGEASKKRFLKEFPEVAT